jgi:hypothetical protein
MLALALTLGVELVLSALAYPALSWPRRRRGVALTVLGLLVLAVPFFMPPEPRIWRFIGGIGALVCALKFVDLHIHVGRHGRPRFGAFLAFLPSMVDLVLRDRDAEPSRPARVEAARAAAALAAFGAGGGAFLALFLIDWARYPFAVEHAAKAVGFFVAVAPWAAAMAAATRMLGGRAVEPMLNPFAARTPADSWRRYNRPVTRFFYFDAFGPLGGRRRPAAATLAIFALSGLVHEYVFFVPVGGVQGYQMAFFLVQGAAVAATRAVDPRGGWRPVGIAATLAFNLATTVLFFASIDQVVPFYAERPGGSGPLAAAVLR